MLTTALVLLGLGLTLRALLMTEVDSTPRAAGARRVPHVRAPVVVLTVRDSVDDTVLVLESAANDYLAKPFHFAELLARVRIRLG